MTLNLTRTDTRSTDQTRTLLRHVENRTFGGLDSTVAGSTPDPNPQTPTLALPLALPFALPLALTAHRSPHPLPLSPPYPGAQLLSEELNFSPRFADISCCHTPCLSSLFEHGAKPAKALAPLGTPSASAYPRPLPSPHPYPHTLALAQRAVPATPLRCRDDAPPAAPPPLASRLRWAKPWRPDADNDARFLRFGRCTAKENACELRGRPSSPTPYPSGAGWASCLVNKHRQHVPGRKPPSTLATVTNIVSRLTPTLLPHRRTSARKLSQ